MHAAPASAELPRRAETGAGKLTDRDVSGLMLCADQYGVPHDLLAHALEVNLDRLRGIVAHWRHAGYAKTGALGLGPAWCWLTPAGMRLLGLPYIAQEPARGRLPQLRAMLAARLWLESGQLYQEEQAWWRSERRIRASTGVQAGAAHVPDAEIHWPRLDGSPYGGQIWAIEAELTPKPVARTAGIMQALLTRTSDYGPGRPAGREARYAQVVYLAAPDTTSVVGQAVAALPTELQWRMVTRDLPPGALLR